MGPREALATREVHLRDVNWIGPGSLDLADGLTIAARLRSTRAPVPARLSLEDGRASVTLLRHEDGVSPGQACVFYASAEPGARVLGGGTIAATVAAWAPVVAVSRARETAAG